MKALPCTRPTAATTRPNPWLLVWLVPWLFLSVASGALHDHGWHGGALQKEKPCATQNVSGQCNENRSQAGFHAAHADVAHHDCLACQWSAQSASVFTLPGSLSVPVLQPVPLQPQAFVVPASLALPALRGRGPPSLLIVCCCELSATAPLRVARRQASFAVMI